MVTAAMTAAGMLKHMIDDKENESKAEMESQVNDRPEAAPAAKAGKQNEGAKSPPTQDRWFDIQLGRMYSDLSAEPLPPEMMALITKLKGTRK